MEMPTNENAQPEVINTSSDGAPPVDQESIIVPEVVNSNGNGGTESVNKIPADQAISVLGVIASTGRFWHDWDDLKNIISFQLKQVLSEYPEAKTEPDQPISVLGETYQQLVKRLDEALVRFSDGPPFTLQRLCEILLDAQGIYRSLSKLALALEKTLLVTTTLTKSSYPYPTVTATADQPDASDEVVTEPQPHSIYVENGGEVLKGDRDEIMTEVEEAEVSEDMTIDTENLEEIVNPSETNPEPSSASYSTSE